MTNKSSAIIWTHCEHLRKTEAQNVFLSNDILTPPTPRRLQLPVEGLERDDYLFEFSNITYESEHIKANSNTSTLLESQHRAAIEEARESCKYNNYIYFGEEKEVSHTNRPLAMETISRVPYERKVTYPSASELWRIRRTRSISCASGPHCNKANIQFLSILNIGEYSQNSFPVAHTTYINNGTHQVPPSEENSSIFEKQNCECNWTLKGAINLSPAENGSTISCANLSMDDECSVSCDIGDNIRVKTLKGDEFREILSNNMRNGDRLHLPDGESSEEVKDNNPSTSSSVAKQNYDCKLTLKGAINSLSGENTSTVSCDNLEMNDEHSVSCDIGDNIPVETLKRVEFCEILPNNMQNENRLHLQDGRISVEIDEDNPSISSSVTKQNDDCNWTLKGAINSPSGENMATFSCTNLDVNDEHSISCDIGDNIRVEIPKVNEFCEILANVKNEDYLPDKRSSEEVDEVSRKTWYQILRNEETPEEFTNVIDVPKDLSNSSFVAFKVTGFDRRLKLEDLEKLCVKYSKMNSDNLLIKIALTRMKMSDLCKPSCSDVTTLHVNDNLPKNFVGDMNHIHKRKSKETKRLISRAPKKPRSVLQATVKSKQSIENSSPNPFLIDTVITSSNVDDINGSPNDMAGKTSSVEVIKATCSPQKSNPCLAENIRGMFKNIAGPWKCDLCNGSQFQSYHSFRVHFLNNHPELNDPTFCFHCGFKLSQKKNEDLLHIFTEHGIRPPSGISFPKCNNCDFYATTEYFLKKHIDSHHGNRKKSKIFSTKYSYKRKKSLRILQRK